MDVPFHFDSNWGVSLCTKRSTLPYKIKKKHIFGLIKTIEDHAENKHKV